VRNDVEEPDLLHLRVEADLEEQDRGARVDHVYQAEVVRGVRCPGVVGAR